MVIERFFSILNQFTNPRKVIYEDNADLFSSTTSVIILLLASCLVTTKSFFLNPISCFIPNYPSGTNFLNYAENYCWTYGTYPILSSETFPQQRNSWYSMKYKINYYQWIPFILCFQTILFYLPKILWSFISSNIQEWQLLENNENDKEHYDKSLFLKEFIIDYEFNHLQKKHKRKHCFTKSSRKRRLLYSYVFIKCLYLFNAVFQLLLIQKFFGYDNYTLSFGSYIKHYIENYEKWDGGIYFPRMTYCSISPVKGVGSTLTFNAQCILSINMLTEKIYVFLWLWTTLVSFVTLVSIVWWFVDLKMLTRKRAIIESSLKIQSGYEEVIMKSFIMDFLKIDGVFVLILLKKNCKRDKWRNIVQDLWNIFIQEEREQLGIITPKEICQENDMYKSCYV